MTAESELAWKNEVVFLDTETTGLDPERHRVWDLAYIYWNGKSWTEAQVYFKVDLATAEPGALRVNNLYKYLADKDWPALTDPYQVHKAWINFAAATAKKHLVGAVPSFDERFCDKEMRAQGLVPAWHYHLVDIEAMMIGFIRGVENGFVEIPWKSKILSERLGVPFDTKFGEQHSALADARWAKAVFEKMMGVEENEEVS